MPRIEDYGDKIGGAKKDLFSEYRERLGREIDARHVEASFSDLFPKPNYQALGKEGMSGVELAAIAVARGSVSRKPTGRNAPREMPRWLQEIRQARTLARRVMDVPSTKEKERGILLLMREQPETIQLTFRALMNVDADAMSAAEALRVIRYRNRLSLVSGKKILSQKSCEGASDAEILRGFSDMISKRADKPAKERVSKTPEQRSADLLRGLSIYKNADGTRSVEVQRKGGTIRFAEGFLSLEAARSWVRANREEIRRVTIRHLTAAPRERTGTFTPRVGAPQRNGNVTAEELAETFGLRGIEFGNYVEMSRRQEDLNAAWDSFSDLADALGMEKRLIGCAGALGLAFGARGSGRAMAHYERDRRVFNLTKRSGAGSVSHEWFHSIDNAGTMRDATDKEGRSLLMMSAMTDSALGALHEAWETYRVRMSAMDAGRSAPYWSKPEEMAARCFETWLVGRLDEDGVRNDHLVEIDRHSAAYPTPEEMVRIGPEIRRLAERVMAKIAADADNDPAP